MYFQYLQLVQVQKRIPQSTLSKVIFVLTILGFISLNRSAAICWDSIEKALPDPYAKHIPKVPPSKRNSNVFWNMKKQIKYYSSICKALKDHQTFAPGECSLIVKVRFFYQQFINLTMPSKKKYVTGFPGSFQTVNPHRPPYNKYVGSTYCINSKILPSAFLQFFFKFTVTPFWGPKRPQKAVAWLTDSIH